MIVATLIEAIAQILHMILNIYTWVIIISALITWVKPDPYNQIVQILRRLTEPVYELIRRYVPTVFGGIDLAPIMVLVAIKFLDLFVVRILFNIANEL